MVKKTSCGPAPTSALASEGNVVQGDGPVQELGGVLELGVDLCGSARAGGESFDVVVALEILQESGSPHQLRERVSKSCSVGCPSISAIRRVFDISEMGSLGC